MTLEEKARLYLVNKFGLIKNISVNEIERNEELSGEFHAYIDGVTENGIIWHDLRKNPEDLPTENKRYLCKIKYYIGGDIDYECFDYDTEYGSWKDACGEVIAWCEVPKFEEVEELLEGK